MTGGRTMGLFGATALGVGAIVGGGILALSGVAFATAGPSAMIAFALNGGIALITAASFAELARRFPESGGIYTYAKKVLSIEVAFVVGWVVWFASIVAGVLYALGFGAFAAEGLARLSLVFGGPDFSGSIASVRTLTCLAAILLYAVALVRRTTGGGNAATVGKVVVFTVLILGGVWAWAGRSGAELIGRLQPFMTDGVGGIARAMGYTFIALQGFDLIAAVGGEVKDPGRTLPRAMYLSLGIALVIYLPLLFLMATVGAPPEGITGAAIANPEALVAEAAERYMGVPGYWLVIGAGVLSMLSALQANLIGASRVAFAMARDRTLPRPLGRLREGPGTPAVAVSITSGLVAFVALVIGDVGAAGAASSLIFLVSFAIVHWAALLASHRSVDEAVRPLPFVGAALCLGLATFQAFAVPEAGGVVALWLCIGIVLYLTLFASGARLADVTAEAVDPDLARLRGRSPLVLVPIANPDSAGGLVDVAATLRTPGVGRVLLLSVVRRSPDGSAAAALDTAKRVLGQSLERSLERALVTETLFTMARDPWAEIVRVARGHGCETVLVGMPDLTGEDAGRRLEGLWSRLDTDIVILRAPAGWRIHEATRLLVPTAGGREHSHLRARVLASLSRSAELSVTFMRTVPPDAQPDAVRRYERELRALARDEAGGAYEVVVDSTERPADAIVRRAEEADLVILGMQRMGRRRALGRLTTAIATESDVPLLLIGRRPGRHLETPWGQLR
ncbi:MAG: amino acid permease [Gemmatimonadota bacterium]|nr:amino acid permease [Gemmatimonadota bacterium]